MPTSDELYAFSLNLWRDFSDFGSYLKGLLLIFVLLHTKNEFPTSHPRLLRKRGWVKRTWKLDICEEREVQYQLIHHIYHKKQKVHLKFVGWGQIKIDLLFFLFSDLLYLLIIAALLPICISCNAVFMLMASLYLLTACLSPPTATHHSAFLFCSPLFYLKPFIQESTSIFILSSLLLIWALMPKEY